MGDLFDRMYACVCVVGGLSVDVCVKLHMCLIVWLCGCVFSCVLVLRVLRCV